jgi:hypothetical protein
MKMAKQQPANAGVLVPHNIIAKIPSTTPAPVTYTTVAPIAVTTPAPFNIPKSPAIFIRPNAEPLHYASPTPSNVRFLDSNSLKPVPSPPSIFYEPPFEETAKNNERFLPPLVIYPSSTPSPNRNEAHLPPIALFSSSTPRPFDDTNVIPLSSTISTYTVKHLDNELLPPKEYNVVPITAATARPQTVTQRYKPYNQKNVFIESSTPKSVIGFSRNNIDAQNYQYYKQGVQSRKEQSERSKYPYYDGVSDTNNGFRYFLPRMYHEEQDSGERGKDGSYGYIDPFGIRRVVYYNAGNNGFVHRKNNRYVGFNAEPYDTPSKPN